MKALETFFLPDLLRQEIEQPFHGKFFALNKEDPTYEAWKLYLERKKEEELDALSSLEKNKKVKKRKF